MSTICFVSYEIHPTTWGGCGVLLRHAAEHLVERGHEVVFLLDIPTDYFERFERRDRPTFVHPDQIRAYQVDALCADFPFARADVPGEAMWKSLRFAHACARVAARERLDCIEFFEYCGVGYYAMVRELFRDGGPATVRAVRLHNSIELMDYYGSSKFIDAERYQLYALERGAIRLADVVLTPTRSYYEEYYRTRYALEPSRVVVSQSPKTLAHEVPRGREVSDALSIVYLGRMFRFKGVEQLVVAGVSLMRQRPESRFTIELIGEDTNDSPLGDSFLGYLRRSIPDELQERFVFPGHLDGQAIAERIARAAFAVFPNRFESFCYALHEVYDAGVPVVINDLPGFRDFFEHERNALVYDGTLPGLVAVMSRLMDDAALRARLARPYPVAEEPLGDFYEHCERAITAIDATSGDDAPGVLAVVLALHTHAERSQMTVDALLRQRVPPRRIVRLVETGTAGGGSLYLLGRRWSALDVDGAPLRASDPVTSRGLVILEAGDLPDPGWLETTARALRRRPDAAFAGTWVTRQGAPEPGLLDLSPERYPFDHGAERARVVMRTEEGRHLADLFDPNLGNLGEVGYLWESIERWGPGYLLPEPMLAASDGAREAVSPTVMNYLLLRYGPVFGDRLALLSGLLAERVRTLEAGSGSVLPAFEPGEFPAEYKARFADALDGRTLLKLALRKLARRLAIKGFDGWEPAAQLTAARRASTSGKGG